MQMSYSYSSDFPFKNFRKLAAQHAETIRKKCLGKELWRVLIVDKSTDHDKPHFDLLFCHNINVKEMFFFIQSARRARTVSCIIIISIIIITIIIIIIIIIIIYWWYERLTY